MRETVFRVVTIGAVAGLLAVAGCGDDAETTTDGPVAEAPKASEFPKPDGRTIDEILTSYTPNEELVLASAGAVFDEGPSRFGFGVFDVSRAPISNAEIALYAAPDSGGPAIGPFPARIESLETDAAFVAQSTSSDPDAAKTVYVSEVDFDKEGVWNLVGLIREGNTYTSSRVTPSIKVGQYTDIPAVGEDAPSIHTPTLEDVSNVEEIDTRQPPTTQHEDDLAEVLGKEPVVLTFATPRLCASRVCGPVADVAEQVKSEYGDEAAFIHVEIYNDNEVDKGLRPEVQAFGLPTEPWVFVIDRDGVVSERFEGALSVNELTDALQDVL